MLNIYEFHCSKLSNLFYMVVASIEAISFFIKLPNYSFGDIFSSSVHPSQSLTGFVVDIESIASRRL